MQLHVDTSYLTASTLKIFVFPYFGVNQRKKKDTYFTDITEKEVKIALFRPTSQMS